MLAQWQIPVGIAVVQEVRAGFARQHVQTLADAPLVEPVIRQPAAAGKNRVLVGLQRTANQPNQLLVEWIVGCRLDRLSGWVRRMYIKACAASGLQITHSNEPIVSFDYSKTAHTVGFCEVADRGKPAARPQLFLIDLAADP